MSIISSLTISAGCIICLAIIPPVSGIQQRRGHIAADTVAFYKVGHRGTRGLMPENTIPAMYKAIDLGANTIEFDVHITKDNKVVVYHDALPNPAYTTMPDGSEIRDRKQYIFYKMPYKDIRQFRIGEKKYSDFPKQAQALTYAPLLGELIDSVERYTGRRHLPAVNYLCEIKSDAKTDGEEQPAPEAYIKTLMKVLKRKRLGSRLMIQSFDQRPLQVLHRRHPGIQLGILIGGKTTLAETVQQLSFIPAFYNPHYSFVTEELVTQCHQKGIKIIPWTVNDRKERDRIKALGVDGVITDYPEFY